MLGLQCDTRDDPLMSSPDYWRWQSYLHIISVLNEVCSTLPQRLQPSGLQTSWQELKDSVFSWDGTQRQSASHMSPAGGASYSRLILTWPSPLTCSCSLTLSPPCSPLWSIVFVQLWRQHNTNSCNWSNKISKVTQMTSTKQLWLLFNVVVFFVSIFILHNCFWICVSSVLRSLHFRFWTKSEWGWLCNALCRAWVTDD